jgi:hypothetical protein
VVRVVEILERHDVGDVVLERVFAFPSSPDPDNHPQLMREPGYDPALTAEQRADLQRRKLVELASLPPDRYPRLVEAAGPMTACDDPEFHYRFGVDLFIAGVEAIARQQAR